MKRLLLIIGFVGLASLTVLGQRKRELTTPVSVNYILPKIGYDVVVTMEREERVPGPFREYAMEQLGVRPEIAEVGEEWTIRSIRFVPRALPDTRAMYTLNVTGEYNSILINVTPEGFLAGLGSDATNDNREQEMVYTSEKALSDADIDYVRFGLRSTRKEVLDSNFTEMMVEGETRRVWDPIERHVLKEDKDYASEIAEDIFAIRKKRLDFLTSGTVTAEALKALDELERNYMSLFMGKKVKSEVVRTFTFVPEKADESVVLFRFSAEEGLTAKNNVSAQPYVIELRNVLVRGQETPRKEADPSRPSLFYREPATADLCIVRGKDVLMTVKCVIPQLGVIKQFPLDVIHNEGMAIEFYPQYGSLKGVKKR